MPYQRPDAGRRLPPKRSNSKTRKEQHDDRKQGTVPPISYQLRLTGFPAPKGSRGFGRGRKPPDSGGSGFQPQRGDRNDAAL